MAQKLGSIYYAISILHFHCYYLGYDAFFSSFRRSESGWPLANVKKVLIFAAVSYDSWNDHKLFLSNSCATEHVLISQQAGFSR